MKRDSKCKAIAILTALTLAATAGCEGALGPAGDPGAMGKPGETGSRGVEGEVGPTGPPGDAGVVGPIGPTGPMGVPDFAAFGSCTGTEKVIGVDATSGAVICDVDVDTDTTYLDGDGLLLLGTTFSADFSGSGLATTVARSDHDHGGVYFPVHPTPSCTGTDKVTGLDTVTGNVVCSPDLRGIYTASNGVTLVGSDFQLDATPCAAGEVWKWTGSAWDCAPDIDTQVTPAQHPRSNVIGALDGPGDVGTEASITLGVDGLPIIAYWDSANGDLKVAKCGDPACSGACGAGTTCTIVDSANDVGSGTSIAIGTDGLPVIAYLDSTNFDLKVAKCGDAACAALCGAGTTCTTLDGANDVGSGTSIAIGTDGLPVIAYLDSTNFDLKVAKCGDAACAAPCGAGTTCTAVDTSDQAGRMPSIAIGTDGLPVIAHYDGTNGDLKVAKCGDAACTMPCGAGATCTTVDTVNDVGRFPSLTIGVDGLPVLSYQDASNGDLKVAKCANGACSDVCMAGTTCTVVDGPQNVGSGSSMTIGSDGLPIISYRDISTNDLKVAKCGDPACAAPCGSGTSCTAVDTAADVTDITSITIGLDGLPIIAYHDGAGFDLKTAKCANAFCLPNWTRR